MYLSLLFICMNKIYIQVSFQVKVQVPSQIYIQLLMPFMLHLLNQLVRQFFFYHSREGIKLKVQFCPIFVISFDVIWKKNICFLCVDHIRIPNDNDSGNLGFIEPLFYCTMLIPSQLATITVLRVFLLMLLFPIRRYFSLILLSFQIYWLIILLKQYILVFLWILQKMKNYKRGRMPHSIIIMDDVSQQQYVLTQCKNIDVEIYLAADLPSGLLTTVFILWVLILCSLNLW